jgi:putative ABC transport system permease protein
MKNNVVLYYRNLRREKTRLLNLSAIAITLTFSFLILFFIEDELSFDRWNRNLNNIFRIEVHEKWPAKKFDRATSTICTGPLLQNEFPEIKSFVRFINLRNPKVILEEREFEEKDFYFTDSSIFEIFPYDLIAGSQKDALANPNSIVLTKELAQKYFGKRNPMGNSLFINEIQYKITGIIKNVPNSHLSFKALLSLSGSQHETDNESSNFVSCSGGVYTYILTHEKTACEQLEVKLPGFYDKYSKPEEGYEYQLEFQPLARIHFNDKKLENDLPTINIKYIYIFGFLLVIVLIFSCLNYVNLVIGNSMKMGKFIGLNKIFGIKKVQIFKYFLFESLINASIAIIISLILLSIILPQYNEYFNKNLSTNIFNNQLVIINIISLLTVIGIIPGLILALIFIPIEPWFIIKNQFVKRNNSLRKTFIFLELSLLIIVIFGSLVLNIQLLTLKNKNLGFDKNNIMIIRIQNQEKVKEAAVLKNSIKEYPNVLDVASSDASIGSGYWIASFRIEIENEMKYFDIKRLMIDEHFTDLYDFEIIEGRTFDVNKNNDLNNCILNEAAVKKLGLATNAINTRIQGNNREEGVIIGVVKDFYFSSKHNEVEPLIISLTGEAEYTPLISVKVAPNMIKSTVRVLNNEWSKFSPGSPFSYSFAEDNIEAFYSNEERLSNVFRWATILSIFIVCFGIICFEIFILEQRSKELSIRKVQGASSYGIIKYVFLKDFLVPCIASLIVVLPICHFILGDLLKSMIVKVSIDWWIYILTAIIMLVVLFLTTFLHLYRAANRNPVESLLYE